MLYVVHLGQKFVLILFLQFLMTDLDTGEKLRFVFDSAPVWEGSARGHVRELPVVRPGQPYEPGKNDEQYPWLQMRLDL